MRRSLLILTLLFTCLNAEAMTSRTRLLMGTYATITLPKEESRFISDLFDYIAKIERSLSTFDPNASLYKLNQNHTIPYNPILSDALTSAKEYFRQTDGYFDVTIGSITKRLYRFGEVSPGSPTHTALQKAIRNIDGFHIDTEGINSDKGIVIDLGGMGKGYAVDHAALLLVKRGVHRGIIALSGDIRCLHRCSLGIQSPFDENALLATLTAKVENLSVSTSGTYRRYATKRSEHHLINPKTARQGDAFVSVTLLAKADNTRIDAYATAISVMPEDRAVIFLERQKDIGYIIVRSDGKILTGNTEDLVAITWLNTQSDHQSIPSNITKRSTKRIEKRGLSTPAVSRPINAGR